MHIFLTGPKRVGKSTAIRKTLTLLEEEAPLSLGGFLTYWGGEGDSCLYITGADKRTSPSLLATRSDVGMSIYPHAFDEYGAEFLRKTQGIQLILMDELGFLEKDSPLFHQAVLACLDGDIPVLGVLREGPIPWHETVKTHTQVAVYNVSLDNRDLLPGMLVNAFSPYIR